jgi:hypothetical protein
MSLNNFIPTVWAGKLLKNLNNDHVYAQGCNRDYEGEITQAGDAVKINSIGRVTIGTYTKNTDMGAPETLDDAQQVLVITESKFFNFQIDDIDKAQQKPKVMSDAMAEASWGLAETADDFLAALITAGVASANILTAATSVGTGPTDDDAYELLVDLDVRLSNNNVPRVGRWVVVPPWYEGLLRKDVRFVSFGTDKNRANLRGEPIGSASGFEVRISNNVPNAAGAYDILAGYPGAVTYAEQIPSGSVKAYEPEQRFADAMKGLHLYGAKVTRPSGLAKVVATAA